MTVIDLPLGPSVNMMFPGKARRFKSAAYKRWINAAGWELKAMKPKPVSGPYSLRIQVPIKMRGDVDNRIKAVADLLVTHSVTPDDKNCHRVIAERCADIAPGRCRVKLNEVAA